MYHYSSDHIPKSQNRRPGIQTTMTSITIHNTANPTSTAKNERGWLLNQYNTRTASWHIAIDEKEAIEAIPLNEVAWHAGNREGNYSSIGIEICESGDQDKVWKNAVHLVATMLHDRKWDTDRIKTHKYWSGKDCPRLILPKWNTFISSVEEQLELIHKEEVQNANQNQFADIPEWKKEGPVYLSKQGLLNNPEQWLQTLDDPMPTWAAMLLLKRIHEDTKGRS
ncbi:hypothetical protein BHU72_05465 [Desulfuribacillus stibiiarsenatis]|uniref:N-acetylmuramoyl-L-alanine amidase n=1 Tax=Desulfuribacillus stibiiarsenatis TaxID=1390249 RepID=A0A1E5L514_9FIRM|nr:N-acetylmuramoyl-L-alanine amidase [Desulfuribacillus stibiiarsenatis]OEH85059.1 hypothetical protein BHU72_05465 [Desulfuribacillus stibiiarsenatis]